jgi:Calcineurin-like phosphoesterase
LIGSVVLAVLALAALLAVSAPAPLRAAGNPCEFTNVGRIVAVGDVHGAYDRFVEILRAAGLVDDRLRWTGGRTHFVQLGDVVDRGPDSAKVLDLLEQLEKQAADNGGAVHALIGNHEVMRMLGDLRYATPGEFDAFVSPRSAELQDAYVKRLEALKVPAAETPPLGYVEMLSGFGTSGRYGTRVRTLDTAVQINGVVFVHGGISPVTASLACDAINERVRREMTDDFDSTARDPLASLSASPTGPLWYRGLVDEADEPAVDDVLRRQRARAIVIAHTVTPNGRIRSRFGGKVVQIDTGMQPAYVTGGRASVLQIERGVMTAIYMDRREVLEQSVLGTSARELRPSGGDR